MKSISLIALDLDETLLDSRKRLSPHNKEALIKCVRMGIQIVPTTRRAVDDIMEGIRMLPGVSHAITASDGTVTNPEGTRYLLCHTLTDKKTLEILSITDKYDAVYDPYINGRGITQSELIDHVENYGASPAIQKTARATRDVTPNVIRYVKECGSDAEKVNIYLGDLEGRKTLREDLGSVEGIVISSSLYGNLEINARGTTKGNTLIWLTDYLSIDRKATMAFGDGENDISTVKAAGVGVAMGNGLKIVKATVDEITLTSDEGGVTAAIERLIIN